VTLRRPRVSTGYLPLNGSGLMGRLAAVSGGGARDADFRGWYAGRGVDEPSRRRHPCNGYFPPPPHDGSACRSEQGLMIAVQFARIAPCSASPAPASSRRLPASQLGR
jgi:hypothetical protein